LSVPFTPSEELPTPSAVPELPAAVPADVCPGEVPSSGLPLSFENDDVAPNDEASVVAPVVAFGEIVPGAVEDAGVAAVLLVLAALVELVVLVVLVVFVVDAAAFGAAAVGVAGPAVTVDVGAVMVVDGTGAMLAAGGAAVVVVVAVVPAMVPVVAAAAITGTSGVKRAASASATDAEGHFG
jgi:hypothetical protein